MYILSILSILSILTILCVLFVLYIPYRTVCFFLLFVDLFVCFLFPSHTRTHVGELFYSQASKRGKHVYIVHPPISVIALASDPGAMVMQCCRMTFLTSTSDSSFRWCYVRAARRTRVRDAGGARGQWFDRNRKYATAPSPSSYR